MDLLVTGAAGQVGRHVTRIASRGEHTVRGMVRDERHVPEIESLGAEPVVADLTGDVDHAVRGQKAVIFAAGSGGRDVWGVDRDGAIRLIDSAIDHDVDRFVMLSAINADTPSDSPEDLHEYLDAKAEADDYLRSTDLEYTIVRPTSLSNEPGTGTVKTGSDLERRGTIPREDVARTLVAALRTEQTIGKTFDLIAGDDSISTTLENPLE